MKLLAKYQPIKEEYDNLEAELTNPVNFNDPVKMAKLNKRKSQISGLVELFEKYKSVLNGIEQAKEMIMAEQDPELIAMAEDEVAECEHEKERLAHKIEVELLPKDENDEKNIIVEIRAGAGGDESALFAAELFRMYARYAEKMHWKVEILDSHENEIGGYKEIVFGIKGNDVYKHLKYESGVHRVQRVPETESGGRIHTSTVTVAVLPEAEEVDVKIEPNEIRVDVFRSSGPGGQSVNTTDSAVQ
jgi:peptide chain release factor 1